MTQDTKTWKQLSTREFRRQVLAPLILRGHTRDPKELLIRLYAFQQRSDAADILEAMGDGAGLALEELYEHTGPIVKAARPNGQVDTNARAIQAMEKDAGGPD